MASIKHEADVLKKLLLMVLSSSRHLKSEYERTIKKGGRQYLFKETLHHFCPPYAEARPADKTIHNVVCYEWIASFQNLHCRSRPLPWSACTYLQYAQLPLWIQSTAIKSRSGSASVKGVLVKGIILVRVE